MKNPDQMEDEKLFFESTCLLFESPGETEADCRHFWLHGDDKYLKPEGGSGQLEFQSMENPYWIFLEYHWSHIAWGKSVGCWLAWWCCPCWLAWLIWFVWDWWLAWHYFILIFNCLPVKICLIVILNICNIFWNSIQDNSAIVFAANISISDLLDKLNMGLGLASTFIWDKFDLIEIRVIRFVCKIVMAGKGQGDPLL